MADPELDPGLASDRTALAWTRSGLTFVACAAFAARAAVVDNSVVAYVLAAVVLTGGVVGVGLGALAQRRRPATPDLATRLDVGVLQAYALGATIMGVAGSALAVLVALD